MRAATEVRRQLDVLRSSEQTPAMGNIVRHREGISSSITSIASTANKLLSVSISHAKRHTHERMRTHAQCPTPAVIVVITTF